MSAGWADDDLAYPSVSIAGWGRLILRGLLLGLLTFGCLGLLLLLRLVERPMFGDVRPLTPHITQFVCRASFPIMGIALRIHGIPMKQRGAVVTNHASWLDIFALNAAQRVYFVSKSEVAAWPGIGWLARATGTVFIARKTADAKVQQGVFEARLRGAPPVVFPRRHQHRYAADFALQIDVVCGILYPRHATPYAYSTGIGCLSPAIRG